MIIKHYMHIKGDRDCGKQNICGNENGEYIQDSKEELFCRKPICIDNSDCGSKGICLNYRCRRRCKRYTECKPYVNIIFLKMIFCIFFLELLSLIRYYHLILRARFVQEAQNIAKVPNVY